jgi:membrane-bound serine protease (ClpP class)
MRRLVFLLFVGVVASLATFAEAAQPNTPGRIEIVDVPGIIDGTVQRAVEAGLRQAERENAALVVLRIDSPGSVGAHRAEGLASRINVAQVPVATWVGPAGAHAGNAAELLWLAGGVRAMSPAATIGPLKTFDLRSKRSDPAKLQEIIVQLTAASHPVRLLTADQARKLPWVDVLAPSIGDLLTALDGREVPVGDHTVALHIDPTASQVRFHKLDLFGRMLHAAAQPSITYLLVLLGLVGLVFEAFHPSTGPAGIAGALAMALAVHGIVVLGGSWLGLALIVGGVGGFAIDLRYVSLGPFTFAGLAALVAGSVLLFHGPWLHVPLAILVFGIAGMTAFLVGAMTRVLRDLRLIRGGQLEVRDAHEQIVSDNGQGGSSAS